MRIYMLVRLYVWLMFRLSASRCSAAVAVVDVAVVGSRTQPNLVNITRVRASIATVQPKIRDRAKETIYNYM